MYSKIILLSLCVLLFSSTQCHSKGENKRNETDDSMVLETISIDKETNTNSYLLTTSKSQEEIEELLSKEHLIILNHKHKNKKIKKESKKAKKEAKKTEKNGVPPSPKEKEHGNNKPPEETPLIVPSSASEPNSTTSVVESTNETNPSVDESTKAISEEVSNNTEIIEPISHVVKAVTESDIESSEEENNVSRGERQRRGEEDDDYYEPIDEFAVIKVERVDRAFLSKIKFNSKEIEMKDEPFSYAYSLVVFLVVLALVILGLQLLFGNSKKQGDYLLIDENPNINEFSLQYSK